MTRFGAILLSLALVVGLTTGCDGAGTNSGSEETHSFSFEEGMSGWSAHAIDIQIGDDTLDWSVAPSEERATDGEKSLRLYADNESDAAKIWAERTFDLEPNAAYRVTLTYDFGTSDWGDLNNWTIISGAHPTPPRTHEALIYQTDTSHDRDTKDLVWLDKSFTVGPVTSSQTRSLTAETDGDGHLYVTIGVWGTFEVPRTYFVDDLTVTFQRVG